jgi:transposase, IS30 family
LKTYTHLTSEERAQISVLHKREVSVGEIARQLRRGKSTISRELGRLGPATDYDDKLAEAQARELAAVPRRPAKRDARLLRRITEQLDRGWSPQQMRGRALREGRWEMPSHETIYQIIAADRRTGGTLYLRLPCAGKKYRRDRNGTKRGHRLRVTPAQDITARPAQINSRSEYGHWEADLMQSKNANVYILAAVERRTLEVRLIALPCKESAPTGRALSQILKGCRVLSVTFDRGLEWMKVSAILARKGTASYFCKPYHSWEKGTIENTNRLLRRYLPKGMEVEFTGIEATEIRHLENELNNRPRAALGYATPREAGAACREGRPIERKLYKRKTSETVNNGCVTSADKAV